MSTIGWKKHSCKRGHINPTRSKSGACVECIGQSHRERYAARRAEVIAKADVYNKLHPEGRRDFQRATRMGVSVSKIREAIAASNMKCECCGLALTHRSLCVDHNHKTGHVRGVLCRFCNALDGMLNKQPDRIEQLRTYLARKSGEAS